MKLFRKINKKFWVPIALLAIVGIGFGAYSVVRAISSTGDSTTITVNSNKIYYGINPDNTNQPWNTNWYNVRNNTQGTDHDAMCMQAKLSTPGGSGTVHINSKAVKYIMLATVPSYSSGTGGPDYYNDFKTWFSSNYSYGGYNGWSGAMRAITNLYNNDTGATHYGGESGISDTDRIFAIGHMLASIEYSGMDYGVESDWSSGSGELGKILSKINTYFGGLAHDPADDYTAFATWVDAETQTVGWLESSPQPPTRIKICKKDTDGDPLSGAVFTVGGTTYTTGSDGCTDWITVDPGTISYTETTAPTGYILYTGTQTCTATAYTDNTCNARDNEPEVKAKVKIKKVIKKIDSEDTVTSYAGISVSGTKFSVLDASGTEVKVITIGSSGTGTSGWLPKGNYTIKEKSVPDGLILNNSIVRSFTITDADNGNTIDLYDSSSPACVGTATTNCIFVNNVKKGKVTITKLYKSYGADDKPLAGVTFTVTHKTDSSITGTLGPTDANGNATSGDLPYGEYHAKEDPSSANEAFTPLLEFDFTISADGTTVNGGTLVNQMPDTPDMSTIARNSLSSADNPDKEIELSSTAGVTDEVTYSGLVGGHKYRLRGELYDLSATSTPIVTNTHEFTAASGGSGKYDFVFSTFNSYNYRDKELGIIQYLEKKNDSTWIPVFTHNADLTDPNQKVRVKNVEISSVATTERTDNKVLAAGTVKILESIDVLGLATGEQYNIVATLKDPSGNIIATKTVNYTMTAPTTTRVTIPTSFEIDSTPYVGQALSVYIELQTAAGTSIAVHNPPADGSETVTVLTPQIGTTAVNGRDNSIKELEVGETTIKDTVTYTGLVSGNQYTIKGEVWKLKADGTKDVKVSENQKSFTATGENGSESLTFNIDTIAKCAVDNKLTLPCKFVVFEYIYFGSSATPFAQHEEVSDNDQIVSVKEPTLQTLATDVQNKTKFLPIGTTTVVDKVTYNGLVAGQTYILKGKLIDVATGNVVKDSNNVEVASIQSFPAAGVSGTVTIDNFTTFDSTLDYDYTLGENQKKYVVYETLYFGDIELVAHMDSTDEDQTVQLAPPKIQTRATYKPDGSNLLGVGDVTMKDYVDYEGLVEGEWYRIEGFIIDPETNEIVEIDNEAVLNTVTFKADTGGKGTVALEINLNTISLQGRKFVVYERLYRSEAKHGDGRLLAVHEEALDEGDQTIEVKVAKIETTAKDKADNDNVIKHETGQIIVDTVHYDGLLMGEDYVLYGYLWNKTANEPLLDKDGNLISAKANFTTSTKIDSGNIEMEFNVDANDLPGVEIVVFEYLFQGTDVPKDENGNPDLTKVVTDHANPDSINQTVRVTMRVGTTASDAYDGDQEVGVGLVKVIDKLKYEGVTLGKKYKAKGWLVDAKTGEKVQGVVVTCTGVPTEDEEEPAEGEQEDEEPTEEEPAEEEPEVKCTREHFDIEGTQSFVAGSEGYEETTGFVTITFEFDSRELIGKKLVAFEELYVVKEDESEELIAEHKDLEDEEQTITVADPEIHTTAVDKSDLDKELANNLEVVIVDKVEYHGLVPGTTYVLHGYLVDKETGERVTANGNTEVTWEFTATRDEGEESIEFTIDTTGLSGKEFVVFERLYIGEYVIEEDLIAEHADINDEAQTVWVKVVPPDTGLFTRMVEGAKQMSVYAVGVVTFIVIGAWGYARMDKRRKIRL